MGNPANIETMEDLDRLIAERLATMPEPRYGDAKPTTDRITRADVQRVLAGGRRMTAREIAEELGTTTRAVHQVVTKDVGGWIERKKPEAIEYMYFLTPGAS